MPKDKKVPEVILPDGTPLKPIATTTNEAVYVASAAIAAIEHLGGCSDVSCTDPDCWLGQMSPHERAIVKTAQAVNHAHDINRPGGFKMLGTHDPVVVRHRDRIPVE